MSQNLDVLLFKEGHSDLGFVGFAQLWDPFIPPGVIDDITFLVTSNNHVADDVNTSFNYGIRVRCKVSP